MNTELFAKSCTVLQWKIQLKPVKVTDESFHRLPKRLSKSLILSSVFLSIALKPVKYHSHSTEQVANLQGFRNTSHSCQLTSAGTSPTLPTSPQRCEVVATMHLLYVHMLQTQLSYTFVLPVKPIFRHDGTESSHSNLQEHQFVVHFIVILSLVAGFSKVCDEPLWPEGITWLTS